MILTEERSRDMRIDVLEMLHDRTELIARLRAEVEAGTYRPNPDDVARAIIAQGL